ncbi:hypothetical protein BJX63DRAFT_438390 [Aspergillus granulosus]|uniref:Uncharacterized protein n=1 Tax=Aspergillus granulosus TaxID=176169 RepID=A0ABR4GS33_9EURO
MLQYAKEMFDLTADVSEMDYEPLNRYHHKPPNFTWHKSIETTMIEPGKFDHIYVYSVAQDGILGNASSEPSSLTQRQSLARKPKPATL